MKKSLVVGISYLFLLSALFVSHIFAPAGAFAAEAVTSKAESLICPSCKTSNPTGSKFCSGCGARIVVTKVFCGNCGAQVSPSSKHCSVCGEPVASAPTKLSPPPPPVTGQSRVSPTTESAKTEESAPPKKLAVGTKRHSIMIGSDFSGTHEISASGQNFSYKTAGGFGIGYEQEQILSDAVGFGWGTHYQFPRGFEDSRWTGGGKFNFWPTYVLMNVYLGPTFYLTGHIGYNIFLSDSEYTGKNITLSNGLYYAYGAGLDSKENFKFSVLFSVHRGGMKYTEYVYVWGLGLVERSAEGSIAYSKLSLLANFTF